MDKYGITIDDSTYRAVPSDEMQRAIKEHEAENLRRAAEKEKMLLEREDMIDTLLDIADKVKKMFARKFTKNRIAQR